MANKISCEEVISKLYDYLDQELGGSTCVDIDEHIKDCRECFSRAEFERALRKKVAGSIEADTPADTRNRLEALIKRF